MGNFAFDLIGTLRPNRHKLKSVQKALINAVVIVFYNSFVSSCVPVPVTAIVVVSGKQKEKEKRNLSFLLFTHKFIWHRGTRDTRHKETMRIL